MDQLANQLVSLNGSREQIIQTAQACMDNYENASLVVFMIESEFMSSKIDRKKFYLFLIHQIILNEAKIKRFKFIKEFGSLLHNLMKDYSLINEIADFDNAFTIINRWEKECIYHPEFLNKLRESIQFKYDQLKKQKQKQNEQESKDLSILQYNIKKIQNEEISKQLYMNLQQFKDTEDEVVKFNTNIDKIKRMKDLKERIQQGEDCKQHLIQNICSLQNIYHTLATQGQQIASDLNSKNKIEYYKQKLKKIRKR